MSRVEWFPETPRERLRFFLRSFPIFVGLVVFLYFGLDWLGAFEFLEHLVQQNSSWLMHTIFRVPYDKFDLIMDGRIKAANKAPASIPVQARIISNVLE
jgi:hypothetical protein